MDTLKQIYFSLVQSLLEDNIKDKDAIIRDSIQTLEYIIKDPTQIGFDKFKVVPR